MLVGPRSRPRCREFTGPTPHSVAVRAKFPSAKPPSFLIIERRRHDEAREEVLAFTKYHSQCAMKSNWEKITDRRIIHGTVQRRVHEAMHQYKMGIEERRERLRDLLDTEEKHYINEMESMEETTLERQAKMRERAKTLRERRESERQKLVVEKRDQQFREQCEELRSLMTHRRQGEVCSDRKVQLAMKEEIRKAEKEQEKLFADLWDKDRLAKEAREEQEALKQMERNREVLDVLQVQRAALEAQKTEEKRLKEEEAQLLKEQRELLKLEKERGWLEKLQNQQQTKNLLDESLRLKIRRLGREYQEEVALDMKIMEQVLNEVHDETEERHQRKIELREEQKRYRQYLAQQLQEQKQQERELDKLLEAELKKSWAKRDKQWSLEKEARKRLMKEVMETRKVQIQDKLDGNTQMQMELAKDRELLAKAIEEHNALEEERQAKQKRVNLEYQDDLFAQMAYQQQLREAEKAEEWHEFDAGISSQQTYQKKLEEILSRPYMSKEQVHPFRRSRVSTPKDWLPV
ncbi:cilia- and flagella-associated protein 53 [Huso huso]|uniref:Cilia- and flagella-associated protein 53 n=1 Tax=Huso huso TaxID=61971 RepID=A0ABR1ABG3_HUSHU